MTKYTLEELKLMARAKGLSDETIECLIREGRDNFKPRNPYARPRDVVRVGRGKRLIWENR